MSKLIPWVATAFTILVGAIVLLGWQLDLLPLKQGLPDSPSTMKANTALCFLLSGLALGALQLELELRNIRYRRGLQFFIFVSSSLICLIGCLTLTQYFFHWNLGIDQLLFPDQTPSATTFFPGRMAIATALNFTLVGCTLFLLRRQSVCSDWFAQGLSSLIAVNAFLPMIGHIFHASVFYTLVAEITSVAPHTAITFIVLSLGMLYMRPHHGFMQTITSSLVGGVLARRLLPWVMFYPLAVNWLIWRGELLGWYEAAFGAACRVTIMTFSFTVLIWWTARSLNRIAHRRQQAEAALKQLTTSLEQQIAERTEELTHLNTNLQQELQERQQATVALRESEAKLAGILDIAEDAIISLDEHQRIILFNQGAEQIFGYSEQEALGQSLDLLLPARFIGVHRQHVTQFGQSPDPARSMGKRGGIFGRRKNGTEFPAEASISKLELSGKTLFTVFLQDITKRKLAAAQLQQSEEKLNTIVTTTSDGILVLNQEGIVQFANPAANKMFEADLSGFKWSIPSREISEIEITASDGTLKTLEIKTVETTWRNAEAYIVALRDISDRKSVERVLRQYERIVSATTDAICLIDRDYKYRMVNQSYLTWHHKSAADILGHSVRELLGLDLFKNVLKPRLDLALTGQMVEFEHWMEYPEMGTQFVSVTYAPYLEMDKTISGVIVSLRNLTKLKQAETAQQRSEEQRRLALDLTNIGFWDWKIQTNETIWNDNHYRLLGLEPGIAPSDYQLWRDRIHPDDVVRVEQALLQALNTTTNYEAEYRVVYPNGEEHWVLGKGHGIYTAEGEPIRMIGTVADITEKKQAEAALQASEARYRAIIEDQTELIARFLPDTTILFVNDAYCRYFGINRDDILGRSYNPVIYEADRANVIRLVHSMNADNPTVTIENRVVVNGEIRWTQWVNHMLFDQQGNFIELQSVGRDITVVKVAEAALQQSEERLQMAFEASGDGLWDWNIATGEVYYNTRYSEMLGYAAAEFSHHINTWKSLVHPDDMIWVKDVLAAHFKDSSKSYSFDYRLRTKAGTWKWIADYGKVVARDEQGKPLRMIGTHRDIDDRKQAELALQRAKADAEAANVAKSTFLATMSHELRTPLNAILGFAQLMSRDLSLNPHHHEQLSIILRSGEHLLGLINNVLDLSKIDVGQMQLDETQFDLHQLLSSLIKILYLKATAKKVHLRLAIAPDVPAFIQADENKLRQILINLLSNAVKFTQEGNVTLEVKVEGGSQDPWKSIDESSSHLPALPCTLLFEVTDTGMGIAPEEIEQLFQPFVQTDVGRKSHQGTGLGLAISQRFVQLMGGEINVKSQVGQGSTFWFKVPIQPVLWAETPFNPPQRQVIGLSPNQPAYKILVAEDKLENRRLAVELLSQIGFEVQAATHGEEAIEFWQQWSPDLILMDMRMPIMDGYEATQWIRTEEQKRAKKGKDSLVASSPSPQPTIIIALTASAFVNQRSQMLAAGCDDYILKPFKTDDLLATIAHHLKVEYTYTTLDSQQPEASTELTPQSLHVMSAEWQSAFRLAIRCLNPIHCLQLIQQIPTEHADLARSLTNLVNQFEFEVLLKLVGPE